MSNAVKSGSSAKVRWILENFRPWAAEDEWMQEVLNGEVRRLQILERSSKLLAVQNLAEEVLEEWEEFYDEYSSEDYMYGAYVDGGW